MFRWLVLVASAGGGVWLALRVLDRLVQQLDPGNAFHLGGEGILILIPVGMIGALLGAVIGGLLVPCRR